MSESEPSPWAYEISQVERIQRELVTKLESAQRNRTIEASRAKVSTLVVPSNIRKGFLNKVEEVKTLLDEFIAALGPSIDQLRNEKADLKNLKSILTEAIKKMDTIIITLNTNKSEKDKACRVRDILKNKLSDIEQYEEAYVVLHDKFTRAIIPQSCLLRRLKKDKNQRPQYEEVLQKLQELKEHFYRFSGNRWSETVEEGPAILTTNAVAGLEIMTEVRDITRELRNRKILRYFTILLFMFDIVFYSYNNIISALQVRC